MHQRRQFVREWQFKEKEQGKFGFSEKGRFFSILQILH